MGEVALESDEVGLGDPGRHLVVHVLGSSQTKGVHDVPRRERLYIAKALAAQAFRQDDMPVQPALPQRDRGKAHARLERDPSSLGKHRRWTTPKHLVTEALERLDDVRRPTLIVLPQIDRPQACVWFRLAKRRAHAGHLHMDPIRRTMLPPFPALAGTPGVVDWRMGWIWTKLVLVAGLTVFHGLLARWQNAFSVDHNMHSTRFFRGVNELPTVALIGIVLLVVVKPF